MLLEKIISGGQSGVDRAALDAAVNVGLKFGGYCPKNFDAEDGKIDSKYQLTETKSHRNEFRTIKNIKESDGTLIIYQSHPEKDGTLLTINMAKKMNKPYLEIQPNNKNYSKVHDWIRFNQIKTLNIAGSRESNCPGIYNATKKMLLIVLRPYMY